MSASLVGSEMCIRDRASASWARCARSAACSSSSSISGEWAGSAAGPSAALSAASCRRTKAG
eukprot:12778210-Alexandrium_andersonii.AAC.1